MTNEEAEAMLRLLQAHYREPVQPVSRYCASITAWFRAIEQSGPKGGQGRDYHQHIRHIERDIHKSNLLARLIYGGQKLRTVPCPQHNGHWCGVDFCDHGCHETGWLPEPHACEPVEVQGWGDTPTATRCQRCGGLPGATVHGGAQ